MSAAEAGTATNTNTKISNSIRCDVNYLKTLPAILKIAVAISSLAGFISVETVISAIAVSHYTWSSFVFISGFCIAIVLILFYLFHIVEALHSLPWLVIEGSYDIIWGVFYFSAACVSTRNAPIQAAWGAAAFFGFLTVCILVFEAFLKYKQWKSGGVAQGERTTTST